MVTSMEGVLGFLVSVFVIAHLLKSMGINTSLFDKVKGMVSFSKTKTGRLDKIEEIQKDSPEDTFNILEVNPNTGEIFFKRLVSVEKSGKIINTEITPMVFKNEVPLNIPIRVFQKEQSRDLTGFLWKIDYKLNPNATELMRVINMKILKAFLSSLKIRDYERYLLIIIALCVLIGAFLYLYIYTPLGDIIKILDAIAIKNDIVVVR